jgi:hypothetical protein|tara:strand:+ start:1182 stop:1817 length:636 start_codon:yes stop_codon:yes gene_type:complete|mmetsp:Transcript_3331/g.11553  ORF Transcript_3331/g.11553 Transcript_3331/m.11553 type:complete len:212 (+) Transcript_3331:252-887(+)
MDWANVTAGELVDALREVDWNTRPRPLREFFAKFTPPKTQTKLLSRVKCNVYYYRANYFVCLAGSFVSSFCRNPAALLACALACFSLLLTNDSFAQAFGENATRVVRKYYPPLAAWMRRSAGADGVPKRPYARVKQVHVCGFKRQNLCGGLGVVSVISVWRTGAVVTVSWAIFSWAVLTAAHASARSPNLKARLSSYREEFRQVFRGYSDA